MTVRDVLACIGRRWYILILVLVAAGYLTVVLYRDGGSYATNTTVTFALPERPNLLPDSGATDSGVIAFAGAVATEVNAGKPVPSYSSADAPFYGAGVREGVLVTLRNAGNQWVSSFPSATIDIQIVGHTFEWVEERQTELLAKVDSIVAAQQTRASVSSDEIQTSVDPLSKRIEFVIASRSAQAMAIGSIALAAILVGGWLCVVVDSLARSRSARRSRTVRNTELVVMEGTHE